MYPNSSQICHIGQPGWMLHWSGQLQDLVLKQRTHGHHLLPVKAKCKEAIDMCIDVLECPIARTVKHTKMTYLWVVQPSFLLKLDIHQGTARLQVDHWYLHEDKHSKIEIYEKRMPDLCPTSETCPNTQPVIRTVDILLIKFKCDTSIKMAQVFLPPGQFLRINDYLFPFHF